MLSERDGGFAPFLLYTNGLCQGGCSVRNAGNHYRSCDRSANPVSDVRTFLLCTRGLR